MIEATDRHDDASRMLKFVTCQLLPQFCHEGVDTQSSLEGRKSPERATDFAALNGFLLFLETIVHLYSCARYEL